MTSQVGHQDLEHHSGGGPSVEAIKAEIESRLGSVPAIFSALEASPALLESFWRQMVAASIGGPLPPLVKAKLLAYLARYCANHWVLMFESCGLHRLGMSGPAIRTLLTTPSPSPSDLSGLLKPLTVPPRPLAAWPEG